MPLRPDLEQRRRDLIERVLLAFKDVKRTGGVSWSQTFVIDDYGTESEIAEAAERDCELDWAELARHGPWNFEAAACGVWGFLDAVGARYYLAAALLLDLETGRSAHHELSLDSGPNEERWSLLDNRQRAVVAVYLRWKRDVAGIASVKHAYRNAARTLANGWDAYAT